MKRLASQGDQPDSQFINLTPMLDVVFILLIFFVVAANFLVPTGATIEKPNVSDGVLAQGITVVLALDAENRIWSEGHKIDIRRIETHLRQLAAEQLRFDVMIEADQQADAARLVQLTQFAQQAGAVRVSVAVTEKRD